jgi:hypothetical protein
MRYWGYLAAKLAVAGAVLGGLLALLNRYWPPEILGGQIHPRFAYNLAYTLITLIWFLLATVALYFIVWDQRYRCRVCLRRLRMPVETDSWGRMLQLGWPRIEYICPYGHGTLTADEVQISGLQNPEWKQNSDNIWDELCASAKDSGEPK